MVRFPNGSRTHISLSAEASLKVTTVSKLAAATSRARFQKLLRNIGKLNTSSSEELKTFFDTYYILHILRFFSGREQKFTNIEEQIFRLFAPIKEKY